MEQIDVSKINGDDDDEANSIFLNDQPSILVIFYFSGSPWCALSSRVADRPSGPQSKQ